MGVFLTNSMPSGWSKALFWCFQSSGGEAVLPSKPRWIRWTKDLFSAASPPVRLALVGFEPGTDGIESHWYKFVLPFNRGFVAGNG